MKKRLCRRFLSSSILLQVGLPGAFTLQCPKSMLHKKVLSVFMIILIQASAKASDFVLVGMKSQATIVVNRNASQPVRLAIQDLISDIEKVTGRKLKITDQKVEGTTALYVQTVSNGLTEQYSIRIHHGNASITGSDDLGTVFGIYYFAEKYLGIDPMYFWSDRTPSMRTSVVLQEQNVQSEPPLFRYRGWFINDEDLLTEWYETTGKRNIDYPFYQQVTSTAIMDKVCETALRLRFNLIIPASFIDILNPDEAALVKEAVKRGMFISMHHVEPMGVSAFTYFNYWKKKTGEKPLFSYYSNRDKVKEVWRAYATEWSKYPNVIWQIGLRGIGDRPMWLADSNIPQTDTDRGRLISEAMTFQMQLIRELDKRSNPPVTTTLWAEGSILFNAGHLSIPPNVIAVFSDNSPGWRWQSDFQNTIRKPENRYGIYYHHQLWGSGPHLIQIIPPVQTQRMLKEAFKKGDTTYCIMNVSNIREFQLGLKASSEMLWDLKSFDENAFSRRWFSERFGEEAKAVKDVYDEYFSAFQLHPKSGTPALMDGQTVHTGNSLLRELKLIITDSVQYAALQEKKKQESEESKWIKTALADMHTEFNNTSQLLESVRMQLGGLQQADSLSKLVLPKLTPSQKAFFESNFLSHLNIIVGLQEWLQAIAQAKLATEKGNRKESAKWLQQALKSFDRIEAGMQLNSKGDKWKQWYRGDKKMNLAARRRLTENLFEDLK